MEKILHKPYIYLVPPWEFCPISFCILTFVFSKVGILVNVLEEKIALLLGSVRNTIRITEAAKRDFRRVSWNIDQVIAGNAIIIEISAICV